MSKQSDLCLFSVLLLYNKYSKNYRDKLWVLGHSFDLPKYYLEKNVKKQQKATSEKWSNTKS